jgi:hypothetical protein
MRVLSCGASTAALTAPIDKPVTAAATKRPVGIHIELSRPRIHMHPMRRHLEVQSQFCSLEVFFHSILPLLTVSLTP